LIFFFWGDSPLSFLIKYGSNRELHMLSCLPN
jgi:hypothetical protein